MNHQFDADVFILGGGPAGLAAAIAARSGGLTVTVADAQKPPIDKACGEGLMPDSLVAAHHLGVSLTPDHGHPFRGIRFASGPHSVNSDFPSGPGVGIRRPVLHQQLIERAQSVGVRLLWSTPVRSIRDHTVDLSSGPLHARWILGADGTQSRLRQWAGLHSFVRNGERFSQRRHYCMPPFSPYMEIHWGHRCQFYVTPVSPHEVCLVLMSRDPHARLSETLPLFPALERRFAHAEPVTPERGALAASRQLHRVTNRHFALVGDASGTVDPISGEGICLAFKQAHAVAHALAEGNLQLYEKAHRAIFRRPRFMSEFMLLLDKSDVLQRRTLISFERQPRLFSNLLALHVGKLTPAGFLKTVASLGFELALA